jgi:hypothetical protein
MLSVTLSAPFKRHSMIAASWPWAEVSPSSCIGGNITLLLPAGSQPLVQWLGVPLATAADLADLAAAFAARMADLVARQDELTNQLQANITSVQSQLSAHWQAHQQCLVRLAAGLSISYPSLG